jgi:lipopolysaccharide transport system ATP-binding protein
MSDTVISVENLSKRYVIGHQSIQREHYRALRDIVGREARTFARKAVDLCQGKQIIQGDELEELWALHDVSFEVKQGEILGVIGRNGAGKSTLLKILSRITEPSEGRVRLRGRVGSLLEVGTGFHPELTGRENIFLNGAILGMSRLEIKRKFDEIVAFAEVEKFLDTPVKRYSSGMHVRLAFAVAAHLEPQILLIDEVLAVGDTEFQKKCLGKVEKIASGGRTVLFVSHNLRFIQQLCSSAIVLANGKITMAGDVDKCLESYLNTGVHETDGYVDLAATSINREGSGECRFRSFELRSLDGNRTARFRFGEPFLVQIIVEADRDIGEVLLGFSFITNMGHEIMGTAAHDGGSGSFIKPGRNRFVCKIDPMILNPGRYFLRAAIFVVGQIFDHVDEVMRFEVEAAATKVTVAPKNHYVGDVYVPYEWSDQNEVLGQQNSETHSKAIL